ncbi:MAG: chemotaxis response regulator protein-glutamate methylesterase [Candidatus Omnitrophota bacterium]
MENKIRVLIVDDSFLMRQIISDIIESDPALEIIGKAKDGKEALEKIYEFKPDVITLDINLPLLDGLSVLEEVMKKQPSRVVMISAYTRAGATATLRALELGAVDFVAKPSGEISLDINKLKDEIIAKIKLAAKVEVTKVSSKEQFKADTFGAEVKPIAFKKLVLIAASTGGPKAVLDVMRDIPANVPASFLIIQHMPLGFTLSFAERISWQSKIKAKEAEEGDILVAGKAFVAPAGSHMGIENEKGVLRIKLNQGPLVNFVRPAADVTLLSVVENYDCKNVVVVVLTGMGKDALEGVRKIKEKGGTVIIQDEKTSVVWGMPKVIYDAGLSDAVLPVFDIAKAILEKI